MKNPIVAIRCFFALLPLSLVAQTPSISPDLIQQYEKQLKANPAAAGPASSERMQQMLREYQKQKGGQASLKEKIPQTGAEKEGREDEKKTADSVKQSAEKSTSSSMYEALLRGECIHPDSNIGHLPTFGYDVFSQTKPSTFAPSDFVSVPADYPINSGDEIIVLVWGRINEEYRLRVSRNGTINIPRIGPVSVAGLPFETMQKNILDRVGTIEGVHASVSIGELRSIGVYIVGEVFSPGFYTISSLSNVTNALFAAGGPTKRGSLRTILLKRGGRSIGTIDFYDFLLSGADRSGLRLQSGDVIHVPIVQSMAAIAGNIRRPALYELKGKTMLADLVGLAGGMSPAAWTNRIQVERYVKNQFQIVLDIDSARQDLPPFEITDGDIIKIFPVLIKDKNAVYLSGNVLRPGKYEFKENMRIFDCIPGYQALLPETYFDYGIILRKDPQSFLDRIIPFNVKNALDNPSSPDNLALRPRDEVVIYNRDFFEPDRSIAIEGAVTKSGYYKLLENMKIRDLILQAGGLSDDASPTRGELYRRNIIKKQVITEKHDFCVECAMRDDAAHNMILQRSDRVYVRQKAGWEEERRVTLKGQVVYPGTYVIFEGETLGDLIGRAGGFKKDAYLSAGVFSRKSVKDLEVRRKEEYLQELEINILKLSSELAVKEQTEEAQAMLVQQMALKEKLGKTVTVGRVIIDFTKTHHYEHFVLEDGDEVFVPRNINTVSVVGEVYNPTTFTFTKNRSTPTYYIEAAGGLKESSDKKHIYVIKANGSIVTGKTKRLSSIELEPGDAVVVPQRVRYTSANKLFVETVDAIFKMTTVAALVITSMSAK